MTAPALARISENLSPAGRAELARRMRLEARRLRTVKTYPTPMSLAVAFDQTLIRTPAVDLVDRELRDCVKNRGRLVISAPPQDLKALACDTPMLTTRGWSTMGELSPGDFVFHPDGSPVEVVGASVVRLGRECYRVTTSDGRSVVADADHLWTVIDKRRETSRGVGSSRVRSFHPETVTTSELLRRGLIRCRWKRSDGSEARSFAYRLPRQHAVQAPHADDLLIDPYVLGAWLGDGDTGGSMFTSADPQIANEIRGAGLDVESTKVKYRYQISRMGLRADAVLRARAMCEAGVPGREACRRVGLPIGSPLGLSTPRSCRRVLWDQPYPPVIRSFRADLRALGVLGNKHIPEQYLTASVPQRLALLQGLMDTDGTIANSEGSCRASFTSCKQRLAVQVLYLVRSLGWRATLTDGPAKLNGRVVGHRWVVGFTPERGEMEPFRLARKLAKVQAPQARDNERHAVSIVSIERVPTRPVRCIKVARDDGLFLAGRDLLVTHNTTSLRWALTWALIDRPDDRLVFASYAAGLARDSGRYVRGLVETHGSAWGLETDRSHRDASDWQLRDRKGGLFTVGIGGGLTGKPSDGAIVDDPLKSMKEADSEVIREAMHDWWRSVMRTRWAPGAWAVVVQTRWVEDDLAGRLESEGWRVVNIPALADGVTPDALGRATGTYLQSTRGRTPADWDEIRADVGERVWAAMYQGRPSVVEGGEFKADWFDRHRVTVAPSATPVVVVDPADNAGEGDEAGVIVARAERGHVFLGPDLSGHMTAARMCRVALLAAVEHSASSVAFEQSLSGLDRAFRAGWDALAKQARVLRSLVAGDWPLVIDPVLVDAGVASLLHEHDPDGTADVVRRELTELWPHVPGVLDLPAGPSVRKVIAKGSKQWRMQSVAPMWETGKVHHVGPLKVLEHQLRTWQPGQDSPDRADAAVHAVRLLAGHTEARLLTPSGVRLPTRSARGARLGRLTR